MTRRARPFREFWNPLPPFPLQWPSKEQMREYARARRAEAPAKAKAAQANGTAGNGASADSTASLPLRQSDEMRDENPAPTPRVSERARMLLRQQLRGGPKRGDTIEAAAQAAAIPPRVLIAAAGALGVKTKNGEWRLPLKFLIIALCSALAWSAAAHAQAALDLSSAGRAAIWRSLGKDATGTQVAAGLQVGQAVPDPMRVLPFSTHLRKKVPAIKSYSYALVNSQVLIVDARTRKIVAIISK